MHNTVILYRSKYGAARKYAAWLASELECDVLKTSDAVIEQIQKYDTVILGGGVYASSVAGLEFLRDHAEELEGKRLCVFAVGASPYGQQTLDKLYEKNMTGALIGVPLFYFRGAWNGSRLSLRDKMLITLMQKVAAGRENDDVWANTLLQPGAKDADWTDKMYIAPMLAFLRGQQ